MNATFNFAGFKQSAQRSWMWRIFFFGSIISSVYFLVKGPVFWALQNIFLVVLIYWVDQMEKEITKRNTFKDPAP